MTACTLSRTWSLFSMRLTWVLIVSVLTTSRAAISMLERPSAMRRRIWVSRGVRSANGALACSARGRGRVNSPMSRRVTFGARSASPAATTRTASNRVVTVADLPARAEAGLFVASPPAVRIAQFHSHSLSVRDPTLGRASFDHVTVAPAGPAASDWHDSDVTPSPPSHEPRAVAGQPGAGDRPLYVEIVPGGSAPDRDGTITVTGSGDIGRVGMGGITLADMDRVTSSLVGVRLGLIGAVALGVLSMTSESKTGMIATTFAASPNRGAVPAAKAVAVAVVVFVTGLGASLAAFFAALALQRGNGYRPPVYPEPSMTDPAVLRAIIGTAAFLALIALFSLAIGALVRRTAGAVIVLFALSW